jgi:ABC-2 type transport system permease protein
MLNFVRIKAMIKKEFLSVLKDPKTRFVLIMPPIIQLFIFTFAATLDVKNVPIGILNLDSGQKGFELVQRFMGSKTFNKIIFLKGQQEIAPLIDNQKAIAVLSIPADFSRSIESNKSSSLLVILDGRRSNAAQIISGYVAEIIGQLNKDLELTIKNSEVISRNWFNPNLIYSWYNVPCLMGVLTMVVCLTITSMSVSRERELGTFDQVLVSPLSPREILIGKVVPAIVISIFEGSLILFVGTFVFGVPFVGNIFSLYFVLLIFSLAVVGIGLFISSLSRTQQQANLGAFIFLSPAISLSGFATPIENMPYWLQVLTFANPLRYMLVVSKAIFLKSMPLEDVFLASWPLFIIALCTLSAAGYYFRKALP